MRKRALLLTLALASLAATSLPALAVYPDKPIRLIVPSAPGGASDALMRTLATQLSQQMGVSFVVDNKPGGSFTIGTMDLVKSAPDGYTLAYGNVVSLATNRSLLPNVPYEVERDLTLVAHTLRVSNLLVVNNALPVKSVFPLPSRRTSVLLASVRPPLPTQPPLNVVTLPEVVMKVLPVPVSSIWLP